MLLERIKAVLVSFGNRIEDRNEQVSTEMIKPELVRLKAAIEALDAGNINVIAESLREVTLSEDINTVIGEISDSILLGEFDKAISLIDNLLSGGGKE